MNYLNAKVVLKEKSISEILTKAGLNDDGALQTFHTNNVLRRVLKYMPAESGTLMKLTLIQTDIRKPYIITDAPQAHYLFMGKLWVDPVTGKGAFYKPGYGFWSRPGVDKVPTETPLTYNTSINPNAGPRWDLALGQELPAMTAELQAYADLLARRTK